MNTQHIFDIFETINSSLKTELKQSYKNDGFHCWSTGDVSSSEPNARLAWSIQNLVKGWFFFLLENQFLIRELKINLNLGSFG